MRAQPLLRAAVAEFAALVEGDDDVGSRHNWHILAASALALSGDESAALEWVERARATLPIEQDTQSGTPLPGRTAGVYARLGRIDVLLPALTRLRTLPTAGDANWANRIRLDPAFQLVREDPRVQAEIESLAALER